MMEQPDEPDRRPDQEVHGHPIEGASGGTGTEDQSDPDYETRACDAYERTGEGLIVFPGAAVYCTGVSAPIFFRGASTFARAHAIAWPPQKEIPSDIKVGEITGWRFWYADDLKLRSWAAEFWWKPGINQSTIDDWGMGFHCYKKKSAARVMAITAGPHEAGVIGEIECWGTVYEHVDGYRAEFARIKSLYVISFDRLWGRRRYERKLREAYGLPT